MRNKVIAVLAAGAVLTTGAQAVQAATPNIQFSSSCTATSWSVRLDLASGYTYDVRVLDKFSNGPVGIGITRPVVTFTFTNGGSFQPIVLLAGGGGERISKRVARADLCGTATSTQVAKKSAVVKPAVAKKKHKKKVDKRKHHKVK